MKKKLFMYVLIVLFVFIIFLYAFTALENIFIKPVDNIVEDIDGKNIIVFEEIHDDNICHGNYLLNNGTIYSYSYEYNKDDKLENKLLYMKDSTESKLDKMKKKDMGYLNMYINNLKYTYFKRTTKTDRPTKIIYYVDYKKNNTKVIISSGELIMKNKSFSAARIISILKKYSIRVD